MELKEPRMNKGIGVPLSGADLAWPRDAPQAQERTTSPFLMSFSCSLAIKRLLGVVFVQV
jgi:hypothetical protein